MKFSDLSGTSPGLVDAVEKILGILGVEHDAALTVGDERPTRVLLVTSAGLVDVAVTYRSLVSMNSRQFTVKETLLPWNTVSIGTSIQASGVTAGEAWIESAEFSIGATPPLQRPLSDPRAFDEFVAAAHGRAGLRAPAMAEAQ